MEDKVVESFLLQEAKRQNEGIELIASENYPSVSVREAQGSIFTAKYAEGYPGHRYYGGCVNVDAVENLAIERAKKLFQVPYANVQPHSGSQANAAAYHALLPEGGKILSLTLNDGGHLTHGSPVSFSSHQYDFVFYSLDEKGKLDYDSIGELLAEEKPDLLLAGYSSYPFAIDFKRLRDILDDYNLTAEKQCLFMVDMAHIAGIVAAGLCQNPCLYADVVTSTTHKTLRGPRGGLILSKHADCEKKINASIFPYSQGGPLEHIIAGKAIAFSEALHPSFQAYMKQVLANTKACNDELASLGIEVSDSENHLFLVNVKKSYGITGKEAEARLGEIGITVNKNMIHGDTEKPAYASGLRLGFAAATSRGCTIDDAKAIARIIDSCLKNALSLEELKNQALRISASWKDVMELSYPLGE